MPSGSLHNISPDDQPLNPSTSHQDLFQESRRANVRPWVLRGPLWRIYFMSFIIAASVFLCTVILHFIISPELNSVTKHPLADLLSALLIGLFAFRSYIRRRDRLQMVFSRIRMVADLNHHVRNALETITLRIYSTGDQALIQDITQATQRIERALREILPDMHT